MIYVYLEQYTLYSVLEVRFLLTDMIILDTKRYLESVFVHMVVKKVGWY